MTTSTALAREIERYIAKTPKSRALQAEAEQVLPGGSSRGTAYFSPYPFFADHGDGHYVYDVDGNRYLDFMLNATTLIVEPHPATQGLPVNAQVIGDQRDRRTRPRPVQRHRVSLELHGIVLVRHLLQDS